MPEFAIPPLYCPFPSTIHPQTEALTLHATHWVQRFHLFEDAAAEHFRAEQYWRLIARVYPNLDFASLAIITDWNSWGFYLDDLGDSPAASTHLLSLQATFDGIMAVLAEAPTVRPEPLFTSLHDIWQRIVPRSTEAWRERLRQTLRLSFLSYIWEATNRAEHVQPTHDTYVRMRVFTGAWLTYVHLFELAEHIALPADLQNHPKLHAYLTAVNNTIVWANDLVSFAKEQHTGETHNLVSIVQWEQGCSLDQAARIVAAYHNAEIQRCLQLERDLLTLSATHRPEIEKYITFAHRFMRGNLDWSMESSRYGQGAITLVSTPDGQPAPTARLLSWGGRFRLPTALWWLGGIVGVAVSTGTAWAYWQRKRR